MVAATDLTGICAQISQQNVYHAFSDKEGFSLISLPQNGWTFKQLGQLIWLPLKALRDATFPGNEGRIYYKIKAIDCTDVSAETDEISDWDWASEHEGDTDVEYDDEGETEDDEQDATSQDSSGEKDSDSEQSLGEEANETSTEQDGQPPDDSDKSDVEASGENAEEELESGKMTGNQFDETMDSDTNNHKLARLPVYHSTQPSNQVPLGQPDPDELLLEPPPDRMHPGSRYFVLDCKITFSRW